MKHRSCYIPACIIRFLSIAFAFLLFPKLAVATCCDGEISQYPTSKNRTYIYASLAPDASTVSSDTLKETEIQSSIFDACKNDENGPVKKCLLSMALRARFSSLDVLGSVAPEEFSAYDLAATFRLPWAWYSRSGWGGGIRVISGIGVLNGVGDNALVVSLIPLLTFGSKDGGFTLDMGAGGALLSRHRFGAQDFGGYFQFALTAGLSIPLFQNFGAGYRFLHYSDAAIYGQGKTGADLHMLELIYRF